MLAQRAPRGSPPRGWGKRGAVFSLGSACAVHPHAGGENAPAPVAPRGRPVHPHAGGENDKGPVQVADIFRFTPTRVGKTDDHCFFHRLPPVHPHAGGENVAVQVGGGHVVGSPPRGWGKRGGCSMNPSSCSVHPHAGGENFLEISRRSCRWRFTPTRVGKTHYRGNCRCANRFTPTRVGKTALAAALAAANSVHPHAGGENFQSGRIIHLFGRFTPTRVGKTQGPALLANFANGSPPRGWGKRGYLGYALS